MVGEVLVTLGWSVALVGLIGAGLVGASKIREPIERRKIEAAREDWVRKYGESGRR